MTTPTVRLAKEPGPESDVLERIEAFESHVGEDGVPDFEGMDLGSAGEFLRALLPGKLHGYAIGPAPPEPTNTEPGSVERIKVLRWRAERGYALHHPLDRRLPSGRSGGGPRTARMCGHHMEMTDE